MPIHRGTRSTAAHPVEYYSALERTESRRHATTHTHMDEACKHCAKWRSQTPKATCCKIPFIILLREFYLNFLKTSTMHHANK